MINFKKFVSLVLSTILFTIIGLSQRPLTMDKVIGVVGSENILYSEMQELYAYAKKHQGDYTPELQCQIIEQLIPSKILLNQARLDSIIIDDAMVEGEVDRRMQYLLAQMNNDESVFTEYYGKSPLEWRLELFEPLKEELTIQRIQGSLIEQIEITPNEVEAFFNEIPKDSIPYLASSVEIAEIVFYPKVNPEEKQKALDKITELKKRIEAGEDFGELASLYSNDPGSGRLGGDLGKSTRGNMVPEFEAEAYNLKEGQLSDIVETEFGFHLIELLKRTGNTIHTRHILITPEITEDDINLAQSQLDSIRVAVLDSTLTFEAAVRFYSDKKTFSYNNAGRLRNEKTGDALFDIGDLPYEIYIAIEELKEGEISRPIPFESRGKKYFKIIKLISKTKPHQASLSQDYDMIQNFAKESKKNEYFNEWMEKKIKLTHIRLDEDLKVCPNLEKFF